MKTPSFRQEGIKSVADLIEPNYQLVTVDLKDGFHHVRIHVEFQKYLGVSWRGNYYMWQVLPFGVQCAPYFFYKILWPVVTFLREDNIRRYLLVDNFLLMASSMFVMDHKDFLLDMLQDYSWQVKVEKCQLTPAHQQCL